MAQPAGVHAQLHHHRVKHYQDGPLNWQYLSPTLKDVDMGFAGRYFLSATPTRVSPASMAACVDLLGNDTVMVLLMALASTATSMPISDWVSTVITRSPLKLKPCVGPMRIFGLSSIF